MIPWNKDTKGVMKANRTSFYKGMTSPKKGEQITRPCEVCKVEFTCPKCFERVTTCSRSCGQKLRFSRSLHPRWIEDRTKLKRVNAQGERRTSAYFFWRKSVWLRDSYACKIANPDCAGRIEAHHILGWAEHPELRYEINNGITLCHAHHPRKRAEEKRLIPTFLELVSVSKKRL